MFHTLKPNPRLYLNTRWYLILFSFLLYSLEGQALNQMQYIYYKSASMIAQGHMISITPDNIDDTKPDFYTVKIQLNQLIKQDLYIDSTIISMRAKFVTQDGSNLISDRFLDSCLSTSWIFFLTDEHLKGMEMMTVECLEPSTPAFLNQLLELNRYARIDINHYFRNKSCKSSCRLCHHIQKENWKGVRRIIARNARQQKSDTLLHHRRVKWVSFDRNILASLPSYMGARMLMLSHSNEVHTYCSYRVGYYKSFCNWLPASLYYLFRIQAYKYFKIERQGTLKLLRFDAHSNAYQTYFKFTKQIDQRLITDTLLSPRYGPNLDLPDEYVLLADVFDGELQLYLDYQTMPDYHEQCAAYIGKLKQEGKVYLLSLITAHTVPVIAEMALKALSELNDPRCAIMLLELAEFTKAQLSQSSFDPSARKDFAMKLMITLNSLTSCRNTLPKDNSSSAVWAQALSKSIPVWYNKLHILGNEEGLTRK